MLVRLLTQSRGPWAVLVIAALVLCVGCQPGGYSGPTGTVSGTVTINDQPVPPGCSVSFISDAGHTASAQVGAGGAYQLSVVGKGGAKTDNIPVATYKVSVGPPGEAGTSAEDADYDKMMEESAGQGVAEEAEEEVIPAAFQSTTTSNLSYEVKEGSQTIDIQLKLD